jgi:hypothetical protein
MDPLTLRGDRMPPEAKILGAGGVVPLLAGVVMAFAAAEPFGFPLVRTTLIYAAMILSFLGGIHWGFASAAFARNKVELSAPRILGLSVLPPLAGWVALLLPNTFAAPFLAASFASVLLLDRTTDRLGYAPGWWMRLRIRLTSAVVVLLLLLSFAEISR